jgi:chromosomal replication initiation ATPase DnaA
LKRCYDSKRQSPVLGRDEFIEKLKGKNVKASREVPRYHRRAVQVEPDRVVEKVAGMYGVGKDEVLRGTRGKENEARKVAMYLVTRCCDRTLGEAASLFGLGSYGAVGWACHGVKVKMEREQKFRDQLERIAADVWQQKI